MSKLWIMHKRCPVGALYYDGTIKVVSEKSKYQDVVAATQDNFVKQEQQLDIISTLEKKVALFVKLTLY